MKKLKPIIICAFAVLIAALSMTSALATTIYTIGGYSITMLNNSEIALCGWDNSSPELVVPASIIGKKMVEVDKYGLADNDGFTTLDFSQAENLTTIGYGGFMNCTGISNDLVIPLNVNVIGFSAFENCTSLPSVTINADVASIQSNTFYGCTALESVEINGYTTSIGYQAFANCPNLTYVKIPNCVTSISAQAFNNSPNVMIGCYADSYALQYAENRRIDHIVFDRQSGDVNFDGSVDVFDATEIQKYAAESTDFTDEQFELGDINKDGFVDVIDALLVQKYVVGSYDIPPLIVRY